jgi:hypothetical protein
MNHYVRQPLHIAAGADANGAVLYVQDAGVSYTNGAFQVSGTVTTATVHFECTVNGTTWSALACVSANDPADVNTTCTNVDVAAGDDVWTFDARGLYAVRARLDWTAGSITVWGTLSQE